jgi:poly(ADP-ribose) glycohydrolase ARH3
LLGLALGDALGAPHEGGVLERLVWRFIGFTPDGKHRYTDDTQMALDLAHSFLAGGRLDAADLAGRFARSYRWSRGYGPRAARVLRLIRRGQDYAKASRSVHAEGSFGNGAAMRAPVVGLICGSSREELMGSAHLTASITHAHPLAQEGAVLIASATWHALRGAGARELLAGAAEQAQSAVFRDKLQVAVRLLATEAPPHDARRSLGNGVAATESCVTAIYVAARHVELPFEGLLACARACGGDVDTIGAMAGAIWGAYRGAEALPSGAIDRIEAADAVNEVASALYERVHR